MSEEEINKILDTIPKTKAISSIGVYNSINVEDLKDAMKRLNKVPTFDNLLEENKQLKDKLQQSEEVIEEAIKMLEINIEIIKQQSSKNKVEDEFALERYNSLLNILNKYKKEESK